MYACPAERWHADGYHDGAAERRASMVSSRWERRYTVKAVHMEDYSGNTSFSID